MWGIQYQTAQYSTIQYPCHQRQRRRKGNDPKLPPSQAAAIRPYGATGPVHAAHRVWVCRGDTGRVTPLLMRVMGGVCPSLEKSRGAESGRGVVGDGEGDAHCIRRCCGRAAPRRTVGWLVFRVKGLEMLGGFELGGGQRRLDTNGGSKRCPHLRAQFIAPYPPSILHSIHTLSASPITQHNTTRAQAPHPPSGK